jgi:hypothetical protein
MAIFDEQVLEPFVAKGIGNSGVASRQIMAGNLPDLSAAVRQSAVTQQNLQDQKNSSMKAMQIANISSLNRGGGGSNDGGNLPVRAVVEMTPKGTFALRYMGAGGGAAVSEFQSLKDLKAFQSSNPYLSSGQIAMKGGVDLPKEVMNSGINIADPAIYNQLYNQAVYGSSSKGGGFKNLKFADPTYLARKEAAATAKAAEAGRRVSWLGAETKFTSDALARETARKAALSAPTNPIDIASIAPKQNLGGGLGLSSLISNLFRGKK